MAKIERKYLAHYINVGQSDAEEYELLGKDLEEYSPSMSATVETKKNILGETAVVISGYEKTGSVEPFYAEANSLLFQKLQEIIDENKTLDQLKTDVVEVKLWEQQDETVFGACKEEAYIEVVSYGGDTTGYQIPFNLHYTGKKVKGTFDVSHNAFTSAV